MVPFKQNPTRILAATGHSYSFKNEEWIMDEEWDEIVDWINKNVSASNGDQVWSIWTRAGVTTASFLYENDATAFKLRWG